MNDYSKNSNANKIVGYSGITIFLAIIIFTLGNLRQKPTADQLITSLSLSTRTGTVSSSSDITSVQLPVSKGTTQYLYDVSFTLPVSLYVYGSEASVSAIMKEEKQAVSQLNGLTLTTFPIDSLIRLSDLPEANEKRVLIYALVYTNPRQLPTKSFIASYYNTRKYQSPAGIRSFYDLFKDTLKPVQASLEGAYSYVRWDGAIKSIVFTFKDKCYEFQTESGMGEGSPYTKYGASLLDKIVNSVRPI